MYISDNFISANFYKDIIYNCIFINKDCEIYFKNCILKIKYDKDEIFITLYKESNYDNYGDAIYDVTLTKDFNNDTNQKSEFDKLIQKIILS